MSDNTNVWHCAYIKTSDARERYPFKRICTFISDDEHKEDNAYARIAQIKRNKYSVDTIKDIFTIVRFKKTPICQSCENEEGNQQAHEYCPDGCLHDKETCYVCE